MNLNVIVERGGANGTNELLPFLQERAEPPVNGDDRQPDKSEFTAKPANACK